MRQADRAGAKFACLLGDNELANNEISVKPMNGEGEQKIVPLDTLVEYLKSQD